MTEHVRILRKGYAKITRYEAARRDQFVAPEPNYEDSTDIILYLQHGLWYVLDEFEVYMVEPELYGEIQRFREGRILWGTLLDCAIFPTFKNPQTLLGPFEYFTINDPVYVAYYDGFKHKVQYLEGEGIQPPDYAFYVP